MAFKYIGVYYYEDYYCLAPSVAEKTNCVGGDLRRLWYPLLIETAVYCSLYLMSLKYHSPEYFVLAFAVDEVPRILWR